MAESTIKDLATALSLKQNDIIVIFDAYKEHAIQFGSKGEGLYGHLKPDFIPIPPTPTK
jgi:hypothetical protein